MADDDDRLLSTDDLAKMRGVPSSRINKERLVGGGPPFIKDGHLVRYRLGDYRDWVRSLPRASSTSELKAA